MNEPLLLVAPDSHLRAPLESAPFQVITWPSLHLGPAENFAALDEAIANLYGYDWIIFVNPDAVRFFIERLEKVLGEVSDLDSIRVCAVGEATATTLENARVHVDVVTTDTNPAAIVENLGTYAGGVDALDRLNFLMPQAAVGRDYLKDEIESTGARVDVVIAYQTVAKADLTRLAGLQSMLLTSSVDAVVFTTPHEVSELAKVFDTNSLAVLLKNTPVIAVGDETKAAADAFGISQTLGLPESSPSVFIEWLTERFGV